jgi:hypothetical protein
LLHQVLDLSAAVAEQIAVSWHQLASFATCAAGPWPAGLSKARKPGGAASVRR